MKDIAEHILDISQNSITAKANLIQIKIHQSKSENYYKLIIIDNGIGMDAITCKKVIDPFFTSRTTRKVGMGIPLLKQNAELSGGSFEIQSEVGKGTLVNANFIFDSFDRIPAGDISGSIVLLVVSIPKINFEFEFLSEKGKFVFNTSEILEIMGSVSLNTKEVRNFLKEMISENINELSD